jgi:serine/threonine-protein kinase
VFETISHYRIIQKLGAGGMGEVYLAEDTRLGRKVAIKLLPADTSTDELAGKRLLREARAAATLDHPNICAVYEVGEDQGRRFIAMQYVDGETLAARIKRQPLKLQEALDVAVQVAEALQQAHAHGIVHRDIKPQNIMLTPRGQAKVLDFGLAKIAPEKAVAVSQAETVTVLTTTGAIMGTVLYMSPEQVKGEELDARSDIFSFGAVIYELLSGRHPFAGASTAEIFSAILTREPQPLQRDMASVPPELQRIVGRCLEKDRERRYRTADELVADLRNLKREIDGTSTPSAKPTRRPLLDLPRGALAFVILLLLVAGGVYWFWTRANAITSIAVLPLAVSSGADPETEDLADGLTYNIIDRLRQIPELKVMSHNAVFSYKGRNVDARTIGRELNVKTVLIWRAVKRNDALTINVELVDAADYSAIWTKQYKRMSADLLAVQRDISIDISENLRVRLNGEAKQRLAKSYTVSPEASQLYVKGRVSLEEWEPAPAKEAVGYFQEAIDKDRNYALAYSGLADALMYSTSAWEEDPREVRRKAKEAAAKALELDPTLGEAHATWADVLVNEWNFSEAEEEFKQAIDLSPSFAGARHQYSHLLLYLGKIPESLIESEKYLELDPHSPSPMGHLGYHYLRARQYDKAIEFLSKAAERGEADYAGLGDAYAQKKVFREAVDWYLKDPDRYTPEQKSGLRDAFEKSGFNGYLRRALEIRKATKQFSESDLVGIAALHARLGEKDEAFDWLKKALDAKAPGLRTLKESLAFDNLRDDTRYKDLLRSIGLPQ